MKLILMARFKVENCILLPLSPLILLLHRAYLLYMFTVCVCGCFISLIPLGHKFHKGKAFKNILIAAS